MYVMSLRDLKRAATKRASQRMARVLCKKYNAVDVRFRTRPDRCEILLNITTIPKNTYLCTDTFQLILAIRQADSLSQLASAAT